jgi:hypothetical protein
MEKRGILPPLTLKEFGTGYENSEGGELTELTWVNEWEEED